MCAVGTIYCGPPVLLRGTIVDRTYGICKNLPGLHLTIFTNNIPGMVLFTVVPRTSCSMRRSCAGTTIQREHCFVPHTRT